MLRLIQAAQGCALSAVSIAALLAGIPDAGAATTPTVLFDDATVDGGSFSYEGTGGALSGDNIRLDTILGAGTASNDGVALTCEDCTFGFVSGHNTHSSLRRRDR